MIGFAGHLRLVAARQTDGRTVLARQGFRAPFHLSKPYWDGDSGTLLVQVVNPTAGILAGDHLDSNIDVAEDAAMLVTTPSASRVFTMIEGRAEFAQQFRVARGAWLEVSPEPLVPHRGSRFRQTTTVDLAEGGSMFLVDQLLPGRIGHGEAWGWSELVLDVTVRVAGEPILRERFAHSGEELHRLAEFAGFSPVACFATAILVPPAPDGDPAWCREVAAQHADGVWVGVSALRRIGWTIRVVAPDTVRLRATLATIRRILAPHFPRLGCNPRKL
ncbi:MAG TPA: urease accessory protein UreD [Opitutaceae bacterium]|nr:urease accessory protein UreD [Opitutaceae bacterium]